MNQTISTGHEVVTSSCPLERFCALPKEILLSINTSMQDSCVLLAKHTGTN
jgi:hypothetical protein